MKVICEKSKLLNSISISLKAIPGKSTMQILNFIAIIAENGNVKLVSNNLELGIETSLSADVQTPGKICVEAKMFSEIIRKLPTNEITMETVERDGSDDSDNINVRTMIIKSGKAKFEISVMSTDEFVFLPNISHGESLLISQYDLKKMISQTEFALSDNENTKIMTGALFEIRNNNLRMVALDGNRISIRNLTLTNGFEDKRVIIPGKTLREISRIISDDVEKNVNIYFSENHVTFKFDDTIVLSRLIDGEYYNVDKMITDDYIVKVKANKSEIYETIDRSMLLRRDTEKKPIVFDIKDNIINFSMKTSIGNMDEDVDIVHEGENIRIGFNPKYMIDALKNIDEEEVDMYFINAKSPCFIRDEEKKYIYLILPINF